MFTPSCLPILIGSLPITDYREAMRLILEYSPDIPLWPQLPKNRHEGMTRQFLDGFPGLIDEGDRFWVNTKGDGFSAAMTEFYEDCLAADAGNPLPHPSRFSLIDGSAGGFAVLLETLDRTRPATVAVKGQVTGPITTGTALLDQNGLSVLADDNLRDILVRLISGKARWQVEQLLPYAGRGTPIIFIDEPAMVSFGSAGFAGITREMVADSIDEVLSAIHAAGGLAGIHICANGDWAPALTSATDIVSFDASSFFDNFILFRKELLGYLSRGGILAWGIVPTGNPLIVEEASVDTLYLKWLSQLNTMTGLGIPRQRLLEQTLIAPACGTGSLPPALAIKVLDLTARLSSLIRQENDLSHPA